MKFEVKVHCSHCSEHLMTNTQFYPDGLLDCLCPSCNNRCEFTQTVNKVTSLAKWYNPFSWGKTRVMRPIKSMSSR